MERRKFTREFKLEAVRLIKERRRVGCARRSVSREAGSMPG
jgi:transposase-like protein